MLKEAQFNATKEERDFINTVTLRFSNYFQKNMHRAMMPKERLDILMDLEAVHSNGCPLDFEKLLSFDEFNFVHDVGGISMHIDRTTGKLKDCFVPRCAR